MGWTAQLIGLTAKRVQLAKTRFRYYSTILTIITDSATITNILYTGYSQFRTISP